MDREETIPQRIEELLNLGWSERKIAAELGTSRTTVNTWSKRIRTTGLEGPKVDRIKNLFYDGATTVEVARAINSPASIAKSWKKKLEGSQTTVDSQLKFEFSKGTTLNKLRNRFDVQSPEEAEELVKDLFTKVILVTKDLPNGDTSFVVVPDTTHEFDWLNKAHQTRKFKYHVSPENNYMYVKFDDDLPDEIKIFNFTDLHIGSTHCRRDLLDQHIEMVEKDPSAFDILGGDLFDYLHKNSVGQPWEQNLAPMEQVSESAKVLMPLADKTIRYQGGNHDRGRGYKLVGADLAEVLAGLLRTSYGHMETTIDFDFKGNIFTAHFHHGGGKGGSHASILANANAFRKYSSYFVHWHLSGHVHNAFSLPHNTIERELGKGLVTKRWFTVVGGSYEARTGSYAEEAKYGPTPQDLSYIVMRADGSYDVGSVPIDSI